MSKVAAIPINPTLMAIAIAYVNTTYSLIADEVLPRIPVAAKFAWTEYDAAQGFTVPDTRIGRKSEPTVVSFTGEPKDDSTDDFGLDDIIPNADIEAFAAMPKPASGGPIDPKNLSVGYLTNLLLLDREIRVAKLVQNASKYGGNTQTMSGASQWSDYANSNPIEDILAALDTPLMRPNVVAFNQPTWTKLRQHPKVLEAIFGKASTSGIASRQQFADVLELNKVLIGSSRVNNARKGQPASLTGTWGNHCSLLHVSAEAAQAKQPTFGFTGQFGVRIAGDIAEPKMGLRGSQRVRVGESVKEVICAPDAGFLFRNVIA